MLNKNIETTTGNQTREFNFIDNIVDGILLSSKKINYQDEPFNIGSNNPIKIKDLVKKIHNLTNSKSILKIGAKKYRPNEIWRMQAENKFILNKVGWKPAINFNQGLTHTIQWYKKFIKVYYNANSSFNNLA